MAGVSDCYTSARGQTATLGNFGMFCLEIVKLTRLKLIYDLCACMLLYDSRSSIIVYCNTLLYLNFDAAKATFAAISRTYTYLTPDLWMETRLTKPPFQEFTDYLSKTQKNQPLARLQAEA
jgi:hypothetical protein